MNDQRDVGSGFGWREEQTGFESKPRVCPVCQSSAHRKEFDKAGFSYVRCVDCGTVYITPVPDASALSELYDFIGDDYFTDPRQLSLDFAPDKYGKEIAFTQKVFAKLQRSATSTGRLLDVGCATGSFLTAAQELGCRKVQGVDISRPAIEYAQHLGLDTVAADFCTTDRFAPGSYDVITMWSMLEHVPNPLAFVQRAYDLLAPEGLLLTCVPNNASLTARLLGPRSRYVCILHLNYFTATSLAKLLTRARLQILHHQTEGINPLVIWRDLRGTHVDIERAIVDRQDTSVIRNSPSMAPLRWLHAAVNGVLRRTGRGELLLMAGQKRVSNGEGHV